MANEVPKLKQQIVKYSIKGKHNRLIRSRTCQYKSHDGKNWCRATTQNSCVHCKFFNPGTGDILRMCLDEIKLAIGSRLSYEQLIYDRNHDFEIIWNAYMNSSDGE